MATKLPIGQGYTVTFTRWEGYATAYILGTYNNVYGWHYINIADNATITNASHMVLVGSYKVFPDNDKLYTYDGTSITTSTLSANVNKLLIITADCDIEFGT